MAIISCPNCQGKLRFPDDLPPRRVKCASCGQGFLAGQNGPIDEPRSGSVEKKKLDPTKSAAKPKSASQEELELEDDRPRRKRPDEDDEDDRPKSKRRRADEEDDDDYDRPKSKRRRADEEDDGRPLVTEVTKAQYRYARQGLNLVGIGFWCQVGALGVCLFTMFLYFIVSESVEELFIPAGLAGLVNWVLGCVGFSFLIAGPRKGNLLGLTIALVAITAAHAFLAFYVGFTKDTSFSIGSGRGRSIQWDAMTTQLPRLVVMILFEFYNTAVVIAAVLEIARFILFTLVVKEYGRLTKNRDVSSSAGVLLVLMPIVVAVSLILFLILRIISKNSTIGSEGRYILFVVVLLEYAGYIATYIMAAVLCGKAKQSLYKRK